MENLTVCFHCGTVYILEAMTEYEGYLRCVAMVPAWPCGTPQGQYPSTLVKYNSSAVTAGYVFHLVNNTRWTFDNTVLSFHMILKTTCKFDPCI